MPRDRNVESRIRLAAYLLCFGSGAAALGYQVVWAKVLGLGLGYEMPAIIATVFSCLGGLAAGSWLFDRFASRSVAPATWLIFLELCIGAWGVGTAVVLPWALEAVSRWMGLEAPEWLRVCSSILIPVACLFPATASMGATFPALERMLRTQILLGRCVGAVYGAQTAGAVAGCLGAVFWLMPAFGFPVSLLALSGLNALCAAGAGALRIWLRPQAVAASAVSPPQSPDPLAFRLRLTLIATGSLGIGFEILGIRALTQVLENTVFTFAITLAVFLSGTAAGGWIFHRWRTDDPEDRLLGKLSASLAVALVSVLAAPLVLPQLGRLYEWCRAAFGDHAAGSVLAEMILAAAVFLIPTTAAGYVFSLLAQRLNRVDDGVGRAAAWNILGGAVGAVLFGWVLLPALGLRYGMLALAVGYGALIPSWRWPQLAAAGLALGLAAAAPRQPSILGLAPGARALDIREGSLATVSVIEEAGGARTLRVNNRFQMGGTAAVIPQQRQAHLPLAMHPKPQTALFLGPGTGITLAGALDYPIGRVEAVELVPEIIQMMHWFEPHNQGVQKAARIVAADARRYVKLVDRQYDVIVADVFHPARNGAGALYTVEHFRAIRGLLAPGGIFCQWLPLHQLDHATLRMIARSFLEVFPDASACLLHYNIDIPVLGLVGAARSLTFTPRWLEADRPDHERLSGAWRKVGLQNSLALLGSFVAGPGRLRAYAVEAPLNTDAHPRLMFEAPRAASFNAVQPAVLLLECLASWRGGDDPPFGWRDAAPGREFMVALRAYGAARDQYLEGLARESRGELDAAIELYLAAAATSLHFTPAYARCVTIIQVLAATDRAAARGLFERLERAQPAQALGRQLLGPLFEPPMAPN